MGGSVHSVVEINHGKRGNRRSADTEVVGKGPLERKPLTLRIEPLYPYAANPIALRCYPSTLTLLTLYPYAANPLPISEPPGGFAVPSWGIGRPFVGNLMSPTRSKRQLRRSDRETRRSIWKSERSNQESERSICKSERSI